VIFIFWLLYFPRNSASTHMTTGWVGSRGSLNAVAKRKIPAPIIHYVASEYTGVTDFSWDSTHSHNIIKPFLYDM